MPDNPSQPSKIDQLLQSRKFWAGTIAILMTVALYAMGELTADQFAMSLTWVAGIYIGSVAVEDGLSRLFTVWLERDAKLIPPPTHDD